MRDKKQVSIFWEGTIKGGAQADISHTGTSILQMSADIPKWTTMGVSKQKAMKWENNPETCSNKQCR